MGSHAATRDDLARLEARRSKAEQVERDRAATWAAIAADTRRLDERTAQLRELRLEKERSEAAALAAEKKAEARRKAKAKSPTKAPATAKRRKAPARAKG